MLSHHSRRAKRAFINHRVTAFTVLAASLLFGLSASPKPAAAQGGPQTQVALTYLRDTDAPSGGVVDTTQSSFISPGFAFISVTASFTGRGYDFTGPGPSQIGPDGFGEEAQISDGDAFIVTPIIDPDLNVTYIMHNETGFELTEITFTLQPEADFYFFNNGTTGSPSLSVVTFDPASSVGSTSFQGLVREGFRSLTFSAADPTDVIGINGFNTFNFSLHIPDGRPGQSFAAVISPNGLTRLEFPTAPEPGTLMLLLPVGMVAGAAARARRRSRACRTSGAALTRRLGKHVGTTVIPS